MTCPRICYNNLIEALAPAAITSSGVVTGYPTYNVTDRREFYQWQGDIGSNRYLQFNMGAGTQICFVGIAGHNLKTALDPAGSITIESAPDSGGSPGAFTVRATIPYADLPLYDRPFCVFFAAPTTNNYWWKIKLSSCPTTAPLIGVVFMCSTYIEFEDLPEAPIDWEKREEHWAEFVGGEGHLLGQYEDFSTREISVDLELVTQTFFDNTFLPFYETNKHKPIFYIQDYEDYTGISGYNWKKRVLYGRLIGEASWPISDGIFVNMNLKFRGLL